MTNLWEQKFCNLTTVFLTDSSVEWFKMPFLRQQLSAGETIKPDNNCTTVVLAKTAYFDFLCFLFPSRF